jgi:hypothetical protein
MFYGEMLEPPLVGSSRLLIQYIHSYPQDWRAFLHPQPEDEPFCGDRDPLIMGQRQTTAVNYDIPPMSETKPRTTPQKTVEY